MKVSETMTAADFLFLWLISHYGWAAGVVMWHVHAGACEVVLSLDDQGTHLRSVK
jgi:hypothetical protein